MIAGVGRRCPVCGKHEKQFIRQGKAGTEYSFFAEKFLFPRPKEPIGQKVHIRYNFYMKTRRKVDKLNLCAAADDILVSAGILKDDNSNIVIHHDGSRVLYDKNNPRTEIFIYEYKEEEDWAIKSLQ